MEKIVAAPGPNRQLAFGALLAFIGALCFSAKAVIVKLAYRFDVDSVSLLALRMLFSLPIYLIIWWVISRKPSVKYGTIARKDWYYIIILGILGYYLSSFLDFYGLKFITASLERLILFLYPTIVVLISAVFFKKTILKSQLWALALTYLGIGLAVFENIILGGDANFYLGAGMIFLCAFTFAFYIAGSGSVIPRVGALRFTCIAMVTACGAILIHHAIVYQLQLFHFPKEVYFLSIIMAVFTTVFPSFLISEGIRIIGASNAAIIGSIGPISTIILAYIFLGERLGPWQWLGTFFVIGGVLIISLKKN